MELCRHAQARRDAAGRVEYYCPKYGWRMDFDGFERCRQCEQYTVEGNTPPQ